MANGGKTAVNCSSTEARGRRLNGDTSDPCAAPYQWSLDPETVYGMFCGAGIVLGVLIFVAWWLKEKSPFATALEKKRRAQAKEAVARVALTERLSHIQTPQKQTQIVDAFPDSNSVNKSADFNDASAQARNNVASALMQGPTASADVRNQPAQHAGSGWPAVEEYRLERKRENAGALGLTVQNSGSMSGSYTGPLSLGGSFSEGPAADHQQHQQQHHDGSAASGGTHPVSTTALTGRAAAVAQAAHRWSAAVPASPAQPHV